MAASFIIEQFPAGYRYSDTEIAVNVKFRANEYNTETGTTAIGFLFMGMKITRQLKNNTTINETITNQFVSVLFNSKSFNGYINYFQNITGIINDNALIIFKFNKTTVDNYFDANLYNYAQIELLGGFTGSSGNSLSWISREGGKQYLTQPDASIFCPANGYSQTSNIFSNSDSFRKTIDDMTLEEFRRIAADRLQCKPEQVRTFTKIINAQNEVVEDYTTIQLTELNDKSMTTAYVQRINAVVQEENPVQASIYLTDEFDNQTIEIYMSQTGDMTPAAVGYFANNLQITGETTAQAIVFIAERLV